MLLGWPRATKRAALCGCVKAVLSGLSGFDSMDASTRGLQGPNTFGTPIRLCSYSSSGGSSWITTLANIHAGNCLQKLLPGIRCLSRLRNTFNLLRIPRSWRVAAGSCRTCCVVLGWVFWGPTRRVGSAHMWLFSLDLGAPLNIAAGQ